MGSEHARLLAVVDGLIAALEAAPSEADVEWSAADRQRWRDHFVALRGHIEQGTYVSSRSLDHWHLMRWLNYDGIGLGPLARKVANLQQLLRNTFADEKAERD